MSDDKTRPKRLRNTQSVAPATPAPTPAAVPGKSTPAARPPRATRQSTPVQAAPPADSSSEPSGRAFARIPIWLVVLIPTLISIAALVVAILGYLSVTEEPEVHMILPPVVRMSQGGAAPILYVQPRFVSTGRNSRIDVITDVSVRADPMNGGVGADFTWQEEGAWTFDPTAKELTYIYLADAGPLMVSPSNPQYPVGLFVGPADWKFQAGDYRITINATRAVGSDPLTGAFTVTFTADGISTINDSQGARFGEFQAKP